MSRADSVAHQQLRSFVDRILRMKDEARANRVAIRELYAEAARQGLDKTTLGLHARIAWQESQGLRVYFIAFRKTGLLKIGISRSVEKRMARLAAEVGEPGEIINSFPGVFPIEGWMHASFAQWRIRGEWFRLCPESESLARAAVNPMRKAA